MHFFGNFMTLFFKWNSCSKEICQVQVFSHLANHAAIFPKHKYPFFNFVNCDTYPVWLTLQKKCHLSVQFNFWSIWSLHCCHVKPYLRVINLIGSYVPCACLLFVYRPNSIAIDFTEVNRPLLRGIRARWLGLADVISLFIDITESVTLEW